MTKKTAIFLVFLSYVLKLCTDNITEFQGFLKCALSWTSSDALYELFFLQALIFSYFFHLH